ncbi:beta-lactamase hydrolase domain-containing protein [Arenimonas composti]|uniref:Beta-lactamase hydrolase-like protein phosphatase-like domain-containing protein n=1 Tax=Arenimonas composti TR7-09 = DSM 18010 TaxID=1121013 RepID=A0A091BDU6_9GAMM|nr:sulfur transferase domain-containing protein [Arenimonas composti]KFN49906.1 hypothetical protein P873_08670 [Arenimonas composti TR7-09 = DSM 18010]
MNLLTLFAATATLAAAGCASTPEPARLPAITNAVAPEPGIVSAGRIGAADLDALRAAGIRHVIDLTPDAETPDFDEAAAVRAAGLDYANLPLSGPADLTRENVQAFDALLRAAGRPVLVHCASGNRVGAMAALRAAWVDGRTADEAIGIGRAWGLKGLEGEVRRLLEEAAPVP